MQTNLFTLIFIVLNRFALEEQYICLPQWRRQWVGQLRRNDEYPGSNIVGCDAGVHACAYRISRIALEYSGAGRRPTSLNSAGSGPPLCRAFRFELSTSRNLELAHCSGSCSDVEGRRAMGHLNDPSACSPEAITSYAEHAAQAHCPRERLVAAEVTRKGRSAGSAGSRHARSCALSSLR
jgi:hypothetical protein